MTNAVPEVIHDLHLAVALARDSPRLPYPCRHVIHPAEAARAARGEVVATFCASCFRPVILNAPETQ